MPLYATRCTTCDDRKDVLVPRTTSELPKCTCGGDREQVISPTAMFAIKGEGVYKPGSSVR
jgi:putative FmdB family regulatory protein